MKNLNGCLLSQDLWQHSACFAPPRVPPFRWVMQIYWTFWSKRVMDSNFLKLNLENIGHKRIHHIPKSLFQNAVLMCLFNLIATLTNSPHDRLIPLGINFWKWVANQRTSFSNNLKHKPCCDMLNQISDVHSNRTKETK